jgi:hypothetical protein
MGLEKSVGLERILLRGFALVQACQGILIGGE